MDGSQGEQPVIIRSPEWLRATVPGQIAWDNARTAWANDQVAWAIAHASRMLAEQILVVATLGSASVYTQGARATTTVVAARNGVAVDATIAGRWAQGTFGDVASSIEYHFARHGAGRTLQQYTDDAARSFQQNRSQAQWGKWNPNWPDSYRLKVGNQGGYFTADGKILTYWD